MRRDPVAGYLTLNYDGLIPVLIKAAQEQQIRLAELEHRVQPAYRGETRASTAWPLPAAISLLAVSLLATAFRGRRKVR